MSNGWLRIDKNAPEGPTVYRKVSIVYVHAVYVHVCMFVCNSCHLVYKEVWSLSALSVV